MLFLLSLNSYSQQRFADLRQRGDSLMQAHRYEQAIEAYEQAEAIGARKIFMTQLFTNLSRCYDAAGRYADELQCYEKLTQLVADPDLMKVKMAEMQLRMGQYQTVADNLETLPTDKRYDAQRITMLASAYHHLGKTDQAITLTDSLIKTHEGTKDDIYWNALNNKAFMLAAMKNHKQATALFAQTVSHYTTDDPRRFVCLGNLAVSEAHNGDKAAVNHIEEAVKGIADTYGTNSHDYIILLRKKAEICLLLGMREQATIAFKLFFAHEKQYITDNFAFMSEQQRRNYWKREQPLIAECFAIENEDPDFLLDVAVFSKSILYQTNIDQRKTDEFEKSFLADGKTVKDALQKDECAVEFVTYIKNNTEHYGAIVAYKDRTTRFVPLFSRDSLLNHQVKAKTGTKPLSYCIAYTDRTMKNALYADTGLYQFVWDKILGENGSSYLVKKVYFSPEADLHLLAVEYLPSAGHKPLFYRLSSTHMLAKRSNHISKSVNALVVGGVDYAAKSLSPADGYVPDRSGSRQMSDDHILPRESSGFAYLKGSKAEADSITSILDMPSVCCLQGQDATEMKVKSMMTDCNVMHISTHGFCSDVLEPQLAVEDKDSLREDKSLLRCGIIMAGANKYAQQQSVNHPYEDGILTSREVSRLDLSNVNLAVLSACQTALGRTTENGMAGMPQGLKKAGVHTIVASLWHVDDTATTLLMTRFYCHLNDSDHPCPQDAMLRAQHDLRQICFTSTAERYAFNPSTLGRRKVKTTKQTNFDAPFFWAPFIVIDGI